MTRKLLGNIIVIISSIVSSITQATSPINEPLYQDDNIILEDLGFQKIRCNVKDCVVRIDQPDKDGRIESYLYVLKYQFNNILLSEKVNLIFYSGSVKNVGDKFEIGVAANCSSNPSFYILTLEFDVSGIKRKSNLQNFLASINIINCDGVAERISTMLQ